MSGYQDGAPGSGLYPQTQAAVLASIAAASGLPTPGSLAFSSVPLTPANTAVPLLSANASRTFLLVYNPTFMVQQFSEGQAIQGALSNLSIGPGQAFFWATAQGLGTVYRGPLTAVTQYGAPLPLWVWQDGSDFFNDGGYLAFASQTAPPDWPASPIITPAQFPAPPVTLPVGAVWYNGGVVGIVPGFVPNPAAPPLFFGSVTSEQLLAVGGGNLPLANPGAGTLQLWNDGDIVAVA